MSLATWKKEFYPVTAKRCSKKNALAHSLQKWLGLRKTALKRHGLVVLNHGISDNSRDLFIGTSSCALCLQADSSCDTCPLCKMKEGSSCRYPENSSWDSNENPEPMIKLLRKCIRKAKKCAK